MPYVDLIAHDDYASIWYITNTTTNIVSEFDPHKPTIIMLHPMLFDSTWLHNHFDDPRIYNNYNVIAFDARYAGKSVCRPSGRLDHWVEAADLAFACQLLQLPPAHVWAEESLATNVALRFAALFPEMCLSLTLVTVPPSTELRSFFAPFDELLDMWGFAEDNDSFEHAISELQKMTLGQGLEPDLLDRVAAFWETTYPPFRRSRFMELANLLMNRIPLKNNILASIHQPVLLIHGEKNEMHPLKYAQQLMSQLCNTTGDPVLYVIKGSKGFLSLNHGSTSVMNQAFTKFLSRQSPSRSDLYSHVMPIPDRMYIALQDLARFMDDPSIVKRDPNSSMSFSVVSADSEKHQGEAFRLYYKDQRTAFSPLLPNGYPIRKFSQRKDDHWFASEDDGLSYYAAGTFGLPLHSKSGSVDKSPGTVADTATSEPVSTEIVSDSQARRAMMNARTMDMQVVKGSMTALASGAASGMPMARKLLGVD